MKKVIKIEAMSCGHCSAAVTKALKALAGVNNVDVNLQTKEAAVEIDDSLADEQLKKAVEEAGYEVKQITIRFLEKAD
jgi:copper chaperone CopZ